MNWSTGDLPGIGGSYKLCPEDFFVEELPLYPCSGQGEHLYLQIEKRGLSTPEMLRQVAASLNLPAREIGYAGLKDAQAITRQWISVPANCEQRLARLDQLQCQVLATNRHDNKLRLGHLAGNRFRLLVRKPGPQAKQKADLILQRFERQGVPNRFGEQRYGLLGNSPLLGHFLRAITLRRGFVAATFVGFLFLTRICSPNDLENRVVRGYAGIASHFMSGHHFFPIRFKIVDSSLDPRLSANCPTVPRRAHVSL